MERGFNNCRVATGETPDGTVQDTNRDSTPFEIDLSTESGIEAAFLSGEITVEDAEKALDKLVAN